MFQWVVSDRLSWKSWSIFKKWPTFTSRLINNSQKWHFCFPKNYQVLPEYGFVEAVSTKFDFLASVSCVHRCCHLFHDNSFQVRTEPVVRSRTRQLSTSKVWVGRNIITKVVFGSHCPGTCVPSASHRWTIMMKHLSIILPPCHITVGTAMPSNIHVFHSFATLQSCKINRIEINNLCANVISVHDTICLEAAGYSPMRWTRAQLFHLGEGQPKQIPVWIIFTHRPVGI